MITEKINPETMTDTELYENICKMIIDTYGLKGFLRFTKLNHVNVKGRDYVKESQNLYEGMSVEELCKYAAKHSRQKK